MSKKGWLSGSSDDEKDTKDNPSSAGSQDPNLQSAGSPGADDGKVKPVNILPDDRSPETDDGSVNPHNEAMAQKPVADPLDRVGDNNERLRNPKTDGDRKDALKDWGRRMRLRGNVMSADWQEFQELTGERERTPSQEDIQAAERKQKEAADKQQAAAARTSAKDA